MIYMTRYKSLLLTLRCGLLLSAPSFTRAMENTNKTPILQLFSRGALLITAAFGANYLSFYLERKLANSHIPDIHKYSLMGGIGAAWLASVYCLIRAAIGERYWNDPNLFK